MNVTGSSMFHRVSYGLLSDSKQLIRNSGIVDRDQLVAVQHALDVGLFTDRFSKILQRDDQAFGS